MARRGRLRDFLEDLVDDGDGSGEGLLGELVDTVRDRRVAAKPAGPVDTDTAAPGPAPAPETSSAVAEVSVEEVAVDEAALGEAAADAADVLDAPTPQPVAPVPRPKPRTTVKDSEAKLAEPEVDATLDLSFDGVRRRVEDAVFPGLADAAENDETGDGLQNLDGDRLPDSLDLDVDGDGVINQLDIDDDNDGVIDVLDPDDDGDGLRDRTETSLVAPIADAKGDLTSDVNALADDDLDGRFAVDVRTRANAPSVVDVDPAISEDPAVLRQIPLADLENDLDNDGTIDERDNDVDGDGLLNRFDPDDDNDFTLDIDDFDEDGDGLADAGENEIRAAHETGPTLIAPTVDVVIPSDEIVAPVIDIVIPQKADVKPATEVRDAGVGDGNAAAKSDLDNDGRLDMVDDDIDGDLLLNADDDDDDSDEILDEVDDDVDGDGFTDNTEENAFLVDAQTVAARDAVGVAKPAVEREPVHARAQDGARAGNSDLDGDSVLDRHDDDIDGDGKLNTFDDDDDGDLLIDGLDRDDDGDGFIDESEPAAFEEFNDSFGGGAAALEVADAERQAEVEAFVEDAKAFASDAVESIGETFGFLGFGTDEPVDGVALDEVPSEEPVIE